MKDQYIMIEGTLLIWGVDMDDAAMLRAGWHSCT